MDLRRTARALLRLLAPEPDPPPSHAAGREDGEFGSWLAELGAEPGDDADLELARTEVLALRDQLENLSGLGERLAESDRARLELEAELTALRAALEAPDGGDEQDEEDAVDAAPSGAGTDAEARAELERLRAEVRRHERARERDAARLAAMREKHDERHRVAAERWRELRRVRGERRRLDQALGRARRALEELRELLDPALRGEHLDAAARERLAARLAAAENGATSVADRR